MMSANFYSNPNNNLHKKQNLNVDKRNWQKQRARPTRITHTQSPPPLPTLTRPAISLKTSRDREAIVFHTSKDGK